MRERKKKINIFFVCFSFFFFFPFFATEKKINHLCFPFSFFFLNEQREICFFLSGREERDERERVVCVCVCG